MALLEINSSFKYYITPGSEREARYLYQEIFVDECYGGFVLPPSPVVIDAGANIGMFSLYMKTNHPKAKLLSFEPVPQTHAILRKNLRLHGFDDVETFQTGLSDKESTAKFTYYATAPGNSTLFPDQKEGLKNLVVSKFPEHGEVIMKSWLGGETQIEIPLQRLSHFLHLKNVSQVDLLKIDVEGAEFMLLNGIDTAQWPLIQNIVAEVSDICAEGAHDRMIQLLEGKGYTVTSKAAHPDFSKDLFIVKATRKD